MSSEIITSPQIFKTDTIVVGTAGETPAVSGVTVYGDVSASSVVYAGTMHTSAGDSDKWSSAYSTLTSTSASWNADITKTNSVFSTTSANSARWTSVYNSVASTSATWNAATANANTAIATANNALTVANSKAASSHNHYIGNLQGLGSADVITTVGGGMFTPLGAVNTPFTLDRAVHLFINEHVNTGTNYEAGNRLILPDRLVDGYGIVYSMKIINKNMSFPLKVYFNGATTPWFQITKATATLAYGVEIYAHPNQLGFGENNADAWDRGVEFIINKR